MKAVEPGRFAAIICCAYSLSQFRLCNFFANFEHERKEYVEDRMRTRSTSLVVLALWFFTLCLKPVKAAGSGTLEVIMHKSDAVHGKQSTSF